METGRFVPKELAFQTPIAESGDPRANEQAPAPWQDKINREWGDMVQRGNDLHFTHGIGASHPSLK